MIFLGILPNGEYMFILPDDPEWLQLKDIVLSLDLNVSSSIPNSLFFISKFRSIKHSYKTYKYSKREYPLLTKNFNNI